MMTHTSNAGRETTHPNETNDCTVVALAHVLGVPYAEAHKIMADAGRRFRRGMKNYEIKDVLIGLKQTGRIHDFIEKNFPKGMPELTGQLLQTYRFYGRYPQGTRRTGTTVAQALRGLPKTGRFYLTCSHHAFAVVDGKLLDNLQKSKMRALMSTCWEIELAPPSMPELAQTDINAMWERLNKLKF